VGGAPLLRTAAGPAPAAGRCPQRVRRTSSGDRRAGDHRSPVPVATGISERSAGASAGGASRRAGRLSRSPSGPARWRQPVGGDRSGPATAGARIVERADGPVDRCRSVTSW